MKSEVKWALVKVKRFPKNLGNLEIVGLKVVDYNSLRFRHSRHSVGLVAFFSRIPPQSLRIKLHWTHDRLTKAFMARQSSWAINATVAAQPAI